MRSPVWIRLRPVLKRFFHISRFFAGTHPPRRTTSLPEFPTLEQTPRPFDSRQDRALAQGSRLRGSRAASRAHAPQGADYFTSTVAPASVNFFLMVPASSLFQPSFT